jgi:molybdopterin molybdotransferase
VRSLDEQLGRVLDAVVRPVPVRVAISESQGMLCAEDVVAERSLPGFDQAAVDGYAVRSVDIKRVPVTLPVVGEIPAGSLQPLRLQPGQAVRVATGSALPTLADAVVPLEHTENGVSHTARVTVARAVPSKAFVRRTGEDVQTGDVAVRAGSVIGPAQVGLLAAVGKAKVRVGRRPTVSILVTGDELVDVWDAPGRGRIRNSNGPALMAQARWAGADARSLGVVPDLAARIGEAVRAGFASDVLVISGGVSAGAFDLVEEVLARFDVGFLFTKVAIKPGAPLVFGRRGDKLVFGLPGNPVSAQVTFDLFVRPALLRMQGARVVTRPHVEVELLESVTNRSGRRNHLPARVHLEGGRLVAAPLRSVGSADVVAHARANALVVMETERLRAEAGEKAPAILLGNFLERDGLA